MIVECFAQTHTEYVSYFVQKLNFAIIWMSPTFFLVAKKFHKVLNFCYGSIENFSKAFKSTDIKKEKKLHFFKDIATELNHERGFCKK